MPTVVELRSGVVHRYVFELRYEFGQVYWDRAGRIARAIVSENENWDFDQIGLAACQLGRRDQNLVFNFGPEKLDLSQTLTGEVTTLLPPGEFGKVAEILSETVVKHLEVDAFPRIGFRVWNLFGTASREQSWELVRQLKTFAIDQETAKSLGTITEMSHRLVVDRGQHMVRISLAPFEQQIEIPPSVFRAARSKPHKHESGERRQVLLDKLKADRAIKSFPQFGLLVDTDAYIEDPPYPGALSASDFVARAVEDFGRIKPMVLAKA